METFQVPLHVILHFKSVAIVLLQHLIQSKNHLNNLNYNASEEMQDLLILDLIKRKLNK